MHFIMKSLQSHSLDMSCGPLLFSMLAGKVINTCCKISSSWSRVMSHTLLRLSEVNMKGFISFYCGSIQIRKADGLITEVINSSN